MERIKSEIKNLIDEWRWHCSAEAKYRCEAYSELLDYLDTLEVKVEPVSKDLEEAADNYVGHAPEIDEDLDCFTKRNAFIAGAQWKESNLWKDAQCDDLPEINREVIVLTKPYPLEGSEYAVSFAHRPSPDGCVGKSVVTGKIEHFTPKTYGKGGWNIPDVKYWLEVELPKE